MKKYNIKFRSISSYDCILMSEKNIPLLIARVMEMDVDRYDPTVIDYKTGKKLFHKASLHNLEDAMNIAKEACQIWSGKVVKELNSNKARLKTIEQILEDIKPDYSVLIKNGYISIYYNDMLWHISLSHLELLGKEVEVKEENDLKDYTHREVKTNVPLHEFWFVKGNK